MTPDFETIRLALNGPLATVTLSRPERLNAAPPAMFDELRLAMAQAREHGARALLLAGEGPGFCAGADLVGAAGDPPESPSARARRALDDHYNPALSDLIDLPMPTIAAVRGAVAGIGASLALTCDFVIASDTAYFLQAFVNVGLVPDGGANWLLPRLVGVPRAAQMTMLGERIPAEQAEQWGLIHRVVGDAELDQAGQDLGLRLANGPTVALAAMRKLRWDALDSGHGSALAAEASAQERAAQSEDAIEGITAFAQKRPPNFKGA